VNERSPTGTGHSAQFHTLLGEDLDAHIAFVIAALEPHAAELGLTGAGA
jgi:hypothetical protein